MTQTALITGANSGIGLELTRRLLAEGWELIAFNRSAFAPEHTFAQTAIASGRLRLYQADMTDFASLKTGLTAILAAEATIDILFNNAGGGGGGQLHNTKQGRDRDFELNTLAPYLVLRTLEPLLLKGARKTVINTSSDALFYASDVSAQTLMHPTKARKLVGPYASAKLALSLWTSAIAPELAPLGVEIRSVNPGANDTKLTRSDGMPWLLRPLVPVLFKSPTHGAAQLHNAAFHFAGQSGIFINKGKPAKLPKTEAQQAMLDLVDTIYRTEFAPPPA